jgi:hypothetical protein
VTLAATIPSETDVLCESCGYILNGLPDSGNCPECGSPIAASLIDSPRCLPAWERGRTGLGGAVDFLSTTLAVILRPTRFYRHLLTRQPNRRASVFAVIQIAICSILAGWAVPEYLNWWRFLPFEVAPLLLSVLSAITVFTSSMLVLRLAAALTAWEAAYRGMRLPRPVVLRGLYYHTAHFLPVMIVGVLTIHIFALAPRNYVYHPHYANIFVGTLCVVAVLGAAYLFQTYWIGMRNMIYANR